MAAALYVSDNNMLVPTTHGAYIARYLAEPYNLPNNRCELKVSRLYEEWGIGTNDWNRNLLSLDWSVSLWAEFLFTSLSLQTF